MLSGEEETRARTGVVEFGRKGERDELVAAIRAHGQTVYSPAMHARRLEASSRPSAPCAPLSGVTQSGAAPPFNEEPDWLVGGGWQRNNDAHPPGEGLPAYRAVFKTMRVILPEAAELKWPNMLIRFGHGSVGRGGMNVPGTLQARLRNRWVLPEAGPLVQTGPGTSEYQPVVNMAFTFAAWQDAIDGVSFVEFLLKTEATEPRLQLAEARRQLAAVNVMLELRFGARLLGLLLTEETGTVFDDWHFNRQLTTDQVGAESQLPGAGIQSPQIEAWAHTAMDRFMERPPPERRRFGLACEWYWTGIHADEPVMQFLHLWFAVEVIAMPNSLNIRPVRQRLSSICGDEPADWEHFVGRLYGKRSRLAHGNEERQVSDTELGDVRAVVEVLLQAEVEDVAPARTAQLRQRAGLAPAGG